ncbi:MAG: hypothetical protein KGL39_15810 [Patescibacteria group bacterium]|nr:hypothetical protein [Patescibacteria group bacterium]
MKNIVVIYHRSDFDGIFCREIARKFLGDSAEYIGWDYGDSDAIIPPGIETIYMLDISVETWMNDPRLFWIDHHKSAMEKFGKLQGYQVDGVAACRLAWQYFANPQGNHQLPSKHAYIERLVSEPLAVRLAGEYDIWDKRDPRAELFQHGLRSQPLTTHDWRWMLGTDCDPVMMTSSVEALLRQGTAIQYSSTQQNESIILAYGFTVQFEGLTFLACNHARFNSHLFTAGIKPEHDALMGFNYDGQKKEWRFSLYHAPGKEHHDLSAIAVRHGGGGHRGACGFRKSEIASIL